MNAGLPSVTAVVSQFPAPSQTFILRKLQGLRAAGCPVTVASSSFGSRTADCDFDTMLLTPWARPTELGRRERAAWKRTATGFLELSKSSGRPLSIRDRVVFGPLHGIDSQIIHFEFSGIAVTYDGMIERLRTSRLVVSCRGAAEQIQPLHDPERAARLRSVFNRMDLIHCVSDDMRRTVEGLGAPTDRILVNRPAVPVSAFTPLAEDRQTHTGPLRVLSVGRLHWKKGLDDGLRAVADAIGQGTRIDYQLAGDGLEREKLAFLAHHLGIASHVRFLGMCSEDEVRDRLRWADVLLLPSLSEGISNAALEAMAAGLPVVSTSCGGMDEVITTDIDGVLVDVGDITAMALALASLADDPGRRARIGRSATERARDEFDISRQVRVFIDAYRRLVA